MYHESEFEKNVYSMKEAAGIIGVTEKTIRNYDKNGKIRTVRTNGGHRRIMRDDLIAFLKNTGLISDGQKKDMHGNNIDFRDSILSGITIKGLLGKWTGAIASDVHYAVENYYMREYKDRKDHVVSVFHKVASKIETLTPVLEDLVSREICGMEDIFIAVFGLTSDEVCLIRKFMELHGRIDTWDEDCMWDDCVHDRRLFDILHPEPVPDGKGRTV